MTKTIQTILSGGEVARLTATITGGGYKRAANKDAAIARLLTVAGEHQLPAADVTLLLQTTKGLPAAQTALTEFLAQLKRTAAPAAKPTKPGRPTDAELEIPANMRRTGSKEETAEVARQWAARDEARRNAAPPAPAPSPAARRAIKKVTGDQTRVRAKTAELAASAASGKMPPAPDFSAETHKPYRARLAELVALAKAGDAKALRAYPIKLSSSSPKALDRYRNLCVIAIEASKSTKAA